MMNGEIKIKNELRPCIVTGQKALFHCWEHYKSAIPSQRRGNSAGVLAIIEREDGTIHRAYPDEIRFIDMEVNRYFGENVTALDFEKQEKKETINYLFTRRNKIY